MSLTLAFCRLAWVLGATSVIVVVVALFRDLQLGLVQWTVLTSIMGGVTTALWRAFTRPGALRLAHLTAVFAVGAVVWSILTTPIALLLGIGMVAAILLPLIVVFVLAVTFRPVILGAVRSSAPTA